MDVSRLLFAAQVILAELRSEYKLLHPLAG